MSEGSMVDRGDLDRRILITAHGSQGRVILWVHGDGRWKIPGIEEDVARSMQALGSAGLFARRNARGDVVEDRGAPAVGFHVFELTAAGKRAARDLLSGS